MTSDTDLRLLGRRRAYQLGRLRAVRPVVAGRRPCSVPRQRRRGHRGPAALWLLALAAGAAGVAAGVHFGVWPAPLAVGLIAGPLSWAGGWRARAAVPAAAALAAAGAIVPALRAVTGAAARGVTAGLAAEAAAAGRAAAALSRRPATVAGVVAVFAVVAVFEMLAGLWLGRLLARLTPAVADRLVARIEASAPELGAPKPGDRAPGDGPPAG